ncbi:hypothetical protein ACFLVP_01565 [Chloroflexota bacterium]
MEKRWWILIGVNVLIITATVVFTVMGTAVSGSAFLALGIGIGAFVIFNVIYLIVWRSKATRDAILQSPIAIDITIIITLTVIGGVIGLFVAPNALIGAAIGAALGAAAVLFIRRYRARRK